MAIELGRVKVGGTVLLALLAVYFFDSGEVLFAAAVSVVIHELGHLTALLFFKRRAAEVRLDLWGVTMRPDAPLSYRQEIITAAAGPLASLLLAMLTGWLGRTLDAPGLYLMAGVSLVFAVFNALPVYPLDGGTVLYAAVCRCCGLERAEKAACVVSCAVILALLILGTIVLITTKANFTLLLAAGCLLFGYCQRSGIRIKSKGKNNGCEAWIKN
jgi:stage IV sporulation protein FB